MHKCKNSKYCPFCRQKFKQKIKDFFLNNPDIDFSYRDIAKEFNMNFWTARYTLDSFQREGIITKKYIKTKKLVTGSGVKIRFANNMNLARSNSKAWVNIF